MHKNTSRFLSVFRSFKPILSASVLLLLLGGVLLFGWAARSRAALQLDIARAGTNALVTWTNAGGVLQSSLTVTGAWNELPGAVSPYPVPMTNTASYFRLRQITPNPALITGIEPAFLSTSGGTFYLIGTNFGSNSVVYLGGVLAGSVTFINSTLLSVNAGAFGVGTYDVSVVNDGQTNAVLANGLTVESSPLVSLESPPAVPPALQAAVMFTDSEGVWEMIQAGSSLFSVEWLGRIGDDA